MPSSRATEIASLNVCGRSSKGMHCLNDSILVDKVLRNSFNPQQWESVAYEGMVGKLINSVVPTRMTDRSKRGAISSRRVGRRPSTLGAHTSWDSGQCLIHDRIRLLCEYDDTVGAISWEVPNISLGAWVSVANQHRFPI